MLRLVRYAKISYLLKVDPLALKSPSLHDLFCVLSALVILLSFYPLARTFSSSNCAPLHLVSKRIYAFLQVWVFIILQVFLCVLFWPILASIS